VLPFLLIVYLVSWIGYIAGLRDQRFAFALWFPLAATSFIGTLLWVLSVIVLVPALLSRDGNAQWFAIGVSQATLWLLICPFLLGLSVWQRPKRDAYSTRKVLPIILLFIVLPLLLSSTFIYSNVQEFHLTVKDTKGQPIEHAKATYTITQGYIDLLWPSLTKTGQVETALNGELTIRLPASCALECNLSATDYAPLRVQMSVDEPRSVLINWYFPAEMKDADDWKGHSGAVQKNLANSTSMELTVFLPKKGDEPIPSYGDAKVF
jgi:hypothetical protein